MNSFFPKKKQPKSTQLPLVCVGGEKNPPEILQPKMLRSLARCPISHTLSAAESRFGEEKSHRNHLQHMKNGICNCYVNGVSNVYIYIYVCVFVNISMQHVYIQTCIFYTYICIFTEVDIYSKSRLYLQGMLTWVFCLQCRTKLCTNYSRSKHDLLNDFHFVYRI